jgi:hypothetical protein
VYGRGGNLLYAILLHQMLNFTGRLLNVDELIVLGGSTAVYVIIGQKSAQCSTICASE